MASSHDTLADLIPGNAGIIQFDVVLGAVEQNLETVKNGVRELNPSAGSLLVLPELWASGFDYAKITGHAQKTPELLRELQALAEEYGVLIAGSLIEQDASQSDPGRFHNTLYITGPSGIVGSYRKQQLFSPMEEDRYFSPGSSPQPIITPLGKIAALVCYDLRFPILATVQTGKGAQIIIVSAQWPASRRIHWQTLLRARAIENQAFVVGCNRCGSTGSTKFGGHSAIVSPNGDVLFEAGDAPVTGLAPLDPERVRTCRETFCTIAPSPYRFLAKDKILPLETLATEVKEIKALGKKIVFTNGCFDLLHQGHVSYLEASRKQGDCLIVGLNSDSSIRAIKGPDRPVNSQESRAHVLAALGCVDYVVIFSEETPLRLITTLLPDVLVKGADWPVDKIVGGPEVIAKGGQVINIPTVEGFSTTNLINSIKG